MSDLAETRDALHQVAEHVLAAIQFAEVGDIRLRWVVGGFETLQELPGRRRLAVVAGELVVTEPGGVRRHTLSTVRAAAEFAGGEAGLSPRAYPPATPLRPDAPLSVDTDDARRIGDWYGLADRALRAFADELGAGPVEPILWPEHFDIGITLGEVNYGASPGDAEVPEPYLYVGPHALPPPADEFWNARFGAARGMAEVASVGDAVGFFRAGRARLGAGR